VDTANPARGPLLVVSGEKDHTVPHAVAHASFALQQHNPGVTEFVEMPSRGHSLTIDGGWREVADTALAFVRRFATADSWESAYLASDEADVDRRVTASVF